MIRPEKSPTAMIMVGNLLIGVHFVLICTARDLASVRASFREYFVVPSMRSDEAITLLNNSQAFTIFSLSTVLILTLVPLLVWASKTRPWVGVVAALVLYLPGILYGREILHLSAKFIDWTRVMKVTEIESKNENAAEEN